MALFRRNKVDETGMPVEVDQYYQAESTGRGPITWVLALVTVLITVLVVLALFYGGRWAYRKFHHNTKKAVSTVQKAIDDTSDTATTGESGSTNSNGTTGSSSSSSSSTNSTSATTGTSGSTTPSTSTTQSTTPSGTSNGQYTTNGGKQLANTGPGDSLAIFLGVSVLAYVLHRRFLAN